MALPRSTEKILNELRAHFLRSTQINSTDEEEHRHRRIIRPHIPDPDDYDEGDEDIKYILTRVESPPIPINVLEDSELVRRLKIEQDVKPKIFQSKDNEDEILKPPLEVKSDTSNKESQIETLTHSLKTDNPPEEVRKGDVSTVKSGSLVTLKLNPHITDSTNISLESEITNSSKSTKLPLLNANATQKLVPNFTKLFRGTSATATDTKKDVRRGNSSRRSSGFALGFNQDDSFDSPDDEEYSYSGEDDADSELYGEDDITNGNNTNGWKTSFSSNQHQTTKPNEIVIDQTYNTETPSNPLYFNDDSKYLLFENDDSDTDTNSDDDFLLDSDFSDPGDRLNHDGFDIKNTFVESYNNILQNSNLSRSIDLASSFVRSTFVRNVDQYGNVHSLARLSNNDKKGKLKRYDSRSKTFDDGEQKENDINKESTLGISKQSIPLTTEKPQSRLSSMINTTLKVSANPLVYFNFVDGKNIKNVNQTIKLIVHIPPKKLTNKVEFIIRKEVSVFDTIGFIVLKLSDKNIDLFKDPETKNPNNWSLSMFDEDDYEDSDDEPDDVFSLLDRLKPIGSYGIDEVALNKVDISQFEKNELKTPIPKVEETTVPPAQGDGNMSHISSDGTGYNYSSMFDASSSQAMISHYNQDDTAMAELRISDYNGFSSEVVMKLQLTNKIEDVLQRYCQVKHINPIDYNLKLKHEKSFYLNIRDTISSLDGFHIVEALTKIKTEELGLKEKPIDPSQNQLPTLTANLTLQTLKLHDESNTSFDSRQVAPQNQHAPTQGQRLRNFSNSLSMNKLRKPPPSLSSTSLLHSNSTNSQLEPFNPNTGGPTNEFHKYKVWRRLPMSFINRHERTFAIDGEYIYILPSDTKYQNFQDSRSGHALKTINCHISQLKTCKISKKNPQDFKVVLIRGNGPKRYDFEACSSQEALEIVNRLKGAVASYKMNIGLGK